MSVVKKQNVYHSCAVCHRTILLGEAAVRYSAGGDDLVDVCALCTDEAGEHGWIKEGTPTTPLMREAPRRRRGLRGILEARRHDSEPTFSEPVLRRLSPPEQAMVEAADLFNQSPYRRTIAGIGKALGDARVSLLPLSGTNQEVVVTVAWDISWYQYRVVFDSAQPVRLAERGYELDELEDRFRGWNGHLDAESRVVPDIPRF